MMNDPALHRPLEFALLNASFSTAGVTLKAEHTHVYCTVNVDEFVPGWLKGKQTGWINAEYALLPGSTPLRSKRDRHHVSGRTMEIQRLISRALRQVVDLSALKERTLIVDCDILQADGGTRTMSINAASVATYIALKKLLRAKKIPVDASKGLVAAISVGSVQEEIIVDLNYEKDVQADVDANFVFDEHLQCIEIQSAAEKKPYSKAFFDKMFFAAQAACENIFLQQRKFLKSIDY